jgi:hypothetical protein
MQILLYPFKSHRDIYNISYMTSKVPNAALILAQVYFMADSVDFTQGIFASIWSIFLNR